MPLAELPWGLEQQQVRDLRARYGTPTFLYSQQALEEQARAALAFPAPFGLTARYAMKACPSAAIVWLLNQLGLHIDASSGEEAWRAIRAGVSAPHIRITSQHISDHTADLVREGALFTATSLHQLEWFGQLFPGSEVTIRVNPGLGSGHSQRTNVGGPSASFGIWHEYLHQALQIAARYGLRVTGLHSHIGSGSDPEVWQRCAQMVFDIAVRLPAVRLVSLGGGFKVGRMPGEPSTDLQAAGKPVASLLEEFSQRHRRQLHLEIEPGTFMVANAGLLVATVIDVVDTGPSGYRFIKVDAGMTEILRPALYGAQHPIVVVPRFPRERREVQRFLVAGHCCESGDVLTPEPGNPEGLLARMLLIPAIGDAVCVGGAGAYCAGMGAKNYNSFREAAEVLMGRDGAFHLIRERQTLDQMVQNERMPEGLELDRDAVQADSHG